MNTGEVSKQLAASAATNGFTPSRMATRVTHAAVMPTQESGGKIPPKGDFTERNEQGETFVEGGEEGQSGRVGDPQFCTRCQNSPASRGVRPGANMNTVGTVNNAKANAWAARRAPACAAARPGAP